MHHKLTPKEIAEAAASKSNVVLKLLEFYTEVSGSPYYDSYVATAIQWRFLMDELKGCPISLNGDKEDKVFDRGMKIFIELKTITDNLEYLKKHMLPAEVEEADAKVLSTYDQARISMEKKFKPAIPLK